jgi:PAS domain S-box-containing protein
VSADSEIVVVGGDAAARAAVRDDLVHAGLRARAASALDEVAPSDEPAAAPALVVVLGDEPAALVRQVRTRAAIADVPVLAIVERAPPTLATESLAAGAADVATLPLAPGVLVARCRTLLRLGRGALPALAPALLRVNDILSTHGDDAAGLVAVLEVACDVLGYERASLLAHLDGSEHCFVIAATDAPTRSKFTLAITDYPEVAAAIRSGKPVIIDDAATDPITADVADKLTRVRGLAVFPVLWRGKPLGALLLRRGGPGPSHVPGQLDLGRLIAANMGAHLRHGDVIQSLREQTHRISRARYEVERRLRGIHSLKEHFEAGADGVVVLDDEGRMLFVNRAAERITGFARDGLLGTALANLCPPDQRSMVADAVASVLAGNNLEPFDLQVSTTTGAPIWVSVSTSTVLSDSGAVILTFRDVSAERLLETELRSTKEFLERLIDSTVDAIIAADLRGNIILFNQGAERLFGYPAAQVIGHMRVWELYEHGVAKQIMRMLRSTAYGGVGRLEQTRREIRTSAGDVVPVSLTASIIYEGEAEVASVGILTDLRERIRMEQRLLQAQQKLQLSERQAMIAELAGAAAHELNQPLTSIMGYAELIQRQAKGLGGPPPPHLRAVGIILAEAERMAGIVKKIGRITKYETTDYVGGARIVDISRSTAEITGAVPTIDDIALPVPRGDQLAAGAVTISASTTLASSGAAGESRDTQRDLGAAIAMAQAAGDAAAPTTPATEQDTADLRPLGDLDGLAALSALQRSTR